MIRGCYNAGVTRRVAWLALLPLALGACELDAQDLASFRETATGPQKLRAVLGDPHRNTALRAAAALSLLDLERRDVDGSLLLLRELRALPADAQRELLPPFLAGLSVRMRVEPGRPPSPQAVHTKDFAVKLLPLLAPGPRDALASQLLRWIAEDVDRRADRGEHALEEIVSLVGRDSARTLAGALPGLETREEIVRLTTAIDAAEGTPSPARARAAARLAQLPHAQLISIVPALGRFADQPAARARLVAMASDAQLEEPTRLASLAELKGHSTEAELPGLLALAQDQQAPAAIRTEAARRAGEPRSQAALPALLTLVTEPEHQALRQAAGELVLDIGGASALVPFLRRLPNAWNMTYARAEIDAYSRRINAFARSPTLVAQLGSKLHSAYWWNRVLGLRYFGVNGIVHDVWRLRQHVEDELAITGDGWPHAYTVGREARANLDIALDRLGLAR